MIFPEREHLGSFESHGGRGRKFDFFMSNKQQQEKAEKAEKTYLSQIAPEKSQLSARNFLFRTTGEEKPTT